MPSSRCGTGSDGRFSLGDKMKGFTLMEAMVATVVFASGVLALGGVFQHFNNFRLVERMAVNRFLCTGAAVEFLVHNPPSCKDSLVTVRPQMNERQNIACPVVSVRLTAIPGISPLAVATVPRSRENQAPFKRILPCR